MDDKIEITARWIEMTRDGKTMWLDMVDGQFAYGGDLPPTAGARLFLEELGHLLDSRVEDAARKLSSKI